jgi:BlaI family transcriptional regulator, penicillinase repressor
MTLSEDEVSLSDLQIDLLRVLWQQGEASTADIVLALQPGRVLAHTTVATLLTRLEKRGVIASRRDARQLVYRALVDQNKVQRSMVSNLLSSLFDGDASALLAHLVDENQIDTEELEQIRKLMKNRAGSMATARIDESFAKAKQKRNTQ